MRSLVTIGRVLLAWLAASAVTTLAASIVQTQFNLHALAGLGVPVPLGLRLQATLSDIAGFGPTFAGIALAGLAIALPVAALVASRAPAGRAAWMALAGAVAVLTAMLLMRLNFELTPVAAARSPAGLLTLCACGALGGLVAARLLPGSRSAAREG